ncbi:MAG TPA: hypothetical protein DCR35_05180 [Runella sp.]|nr:hypothetical protein [Runella sp.]HAO48733.1 hypothetical protein [Runella sp.]
MPLPKIDSLKILSQSSPDSGSFLSDAADWANVLVAAFAFFFSIYTYHSQRKKDRENNLETQKQQEKNIRLQWYKDVVISPRVDKLNHFFNQLHTLRNQITTPDLDNDTKIELIDFCKNELSSLRKEFIDFILPINAVLYEKIKQELDNLIDSLTQTIDNDTLKLNNPVVYEAHINSHIVKTYTNVFTFVFSYEGN